MHHANRFFFANRLRLEPAPIWFPASPVGGAQPAPAQTTHPAQNKIPKRTIFMRRRRLFDRPGAFKAGNPPLLPRFQPSRPSDPSDPSDAWHSRHKPPRSLHITPVLLPKSGEQILLLLSRANYLQHHDHTA